MAISTFFGWMTDPGLLGTIVVLLVAAPMTYLLLLQLERSISKRAAERTSDLLLVIPLVLGLLAALNELSEFQDERDQLQATLKRTELDNGISVSMASLSDMARQQLAICRDGEESALVNNMIKELEDVRSDLENEQQDCPARPLERCGSLSNLARNSLVWAAAPARAAELLDRCEVKQTTLFVERNAFLFRDMMDRQQSEDLMPGLRAMSANLQERVNVDARLRGNTDGSPSFRVLGYWLIVLAAAVEIARIARNFRRVEV